MVSNAAVSPPSPVVDPTPAAAARSGLLGRGVALAAGAAVVAVVVAAVASTAGATGLEDLAAAGFVASLALTGALGLASRAEDPTEGAP